MLKVPRHRRVRSYELEAVLISTLTGQLVEHAGNERTIEVRDIAGFDILGNGRAPISVRLQAAMDPLHREDESR